MSISLCMIVKNEEKNLPRCLESVKDIVDEMIIVDTGSTDSTVKIAENYGAKVYQSEWNGSFSDARNYSLKYASCPWIMIMDADDQLEESGKKRVLEIIENGDADAYFFETISFVGDRPGTDVLRNMNLRLMKNGKGYFYSNSIHEQIYCNIKAVNPNAKIENTDIKVYHYGYLNSNITEHNKRARNIALLEKELQEKPGYPFALFNLGSEYYAMGNNLKALGYFEESYGKFNPKEGFSSHLLLKMVNCYLALGRFHDALRLCDEGLSYFPQFTDLVYMKGIIYNSSGKLLSAIGQFQSCLRMGEGPNFLNVIVGAGTFRADFMIAEISFVLEDYSSAAERYLSCLRRNPRYVSAVSQAVRSMCRENPDSEILKSGIDELRAILYEDLNSAIIDTLIEEKYYDFALDEIKEYEKKVSPTSYTNYAKALCKLFLKKFKESSRSAGVAAKDQSYKNKAACVKILCKISEDNYNVSPLLNKLDNDIIKNTYRALWDTLSGRDTPVLCDDENMSRLYTNVIFDILKVFITTHQFDKFEKALNLLNSVHDSSVLLRLGKLYYGNECFKLAYEELIRSIRIFNVIDPEGTRILYSLKLKGL